MSDNVTINAEYEIATHKKQVSYPISLNEWKFIKKKINEIKEKTDFFFRAFFCLLGVAIPSVITAIVEDKNKFNAKDFESFTSN